MSDQADPQATGQGLLNQVLNWLWGNIVPVGIGGLLLSFLASQTGKDKNSQLFDFIPEGVVRDTLNGIARFLGELWNSASTWLRKQLAGEELAAEEGMAARIDASDAFAKIEQDLQSAHVPGGIGQTLKQKVQEAKTAFFSAGISPEPSAAFSNASELFTTIRGTIFDALKKANPTADVATQETFKKYAALKAAEITGLPLDPANPAEHVSTEYLTAGNVTTGYAAWLVKIQADVQAKGDYDASTMPALTINLSQQQPMAGESLAPTAAVSSLPVAPPAASVPAK